MLVARPSTLAHSASINAPYQFSRSPNSPIFSPNVSPYTQHIFYAHRPSKTMPRPNPPPTPGSSSDLRGKEGGDAAPTFNLPPTAFQEADRSSASSASRSANGSDSSYRPLSPTSPAGVSRKRSATETSPVITKDDFALPPPPTRSRKIIQMKPGGSEQQQRSPQPHTKSGRTQSANQSGTKRKQNNVNTTAAGRKIARKTAHSLIERRRRSKMNDEFGVLKDMIPACRGQDMHKLAILQVSDSKKQRKLEMMLIVTRQA